MDGFLGSGNFPSFDQCPKSVLATSVLKMPRVILKKLKPTLKQIDFGKFLQLKYVYWSFLMNNTVN